MSNSQLGAIVAVDLAAKQTGLPAGVVRSTVNFLRSCTFDHIKGDRLSYSLSCSTPLGGAHGACAVTLGLAMAWMVVLSVAVMMLGPSIYRAQKTTAPTKNARASMPTAAGVFLRLVVCSAALDYMSKLFGLADGIVTMSSDFLLQCISNAACKPPPGGVRGAAAVTIGLALGWTLLLCGAVTIFGDQIYAQLRGKPASSSLSAWAAFYAAALTVAHMANNACYSAEANKSEPLADWLHSSLPVVDHTDTSSWAWGLPDKLLLVTVVPVLLTVLTSRRRNALIQVPLTTMFTATHMRAW